MAPHGGGHADGVGASWSPQPSTVCSQSIGGQWSAYMSAGSVVGTPPRTIQLLVNARHLTGPKTGIEVYMEQLLQALAATGEASITALSWAPLGLEFPGVREVIPVRRPELAGVRA